MYDWHPHTVQKLFERVNINDLPDNQHDRTCKICEKPYEKGPDYNTSEPWTRLPTPPAEEPVRLVCGHVFGETCIQLWTFPKPFGNDCNSCPLCREPVFVLSDLQEMLYHEEMDNYAAEGCLIEDYTVVDFLCTWIEGEEEEGEGDKEKEEKEKKEKEEEEQDEDTENNEDGNLSAEKSAQEVEMASNHGC